VWAFSQGSSVVPFRPSNWPSSSSSSIGLFLGASNIFFLFGWWASFLGLSPKRKKKRKKKNHTLNQIGGLPIFFH
jgi:hypothetical protein